MAPKGNESSYQLLGISEGELALSFRGGRYVYIYIYIIYVCIYMSDVVLIYDI